MYVGRLVNVVLCCVMWWMNGEFCGVIVIGFISVRFVYVMLLRKCVCSVVVLL